MALTKKELTKERIQQAAYQCVARYGFEKTTLDDIAAVVGLNKASLYYYYKNKEEIFLDVTSTATRQFVEKLQSSTLVIEGGVTEQVRHYLFERSVYFIQLVEKVHISEETIRQVEHLFNELIRDVAAQEVVFLQKILDLSVENASIQPIDTQLFAANLITLSEGIKVAAKSNAPDLRDIPAITAVIHRNLNLMIDILFKGLQSKLF